MPASKSSPTTTATKPTNPTGGNGPALIGALKQKYVSPGLEPGKKRKTATYLDAKATPTAVELAPPSPILTSRYWSARFRPHYAMTTPHKQFILSTLIREATSIRPSSLVPKPTDNIGRLRAFYRAITRKVTGKL